MESQEIINISLIVLVIFLIIYVICLNMKVNNNMSETFASEQDVITTDTDDKKFGISEAIKNLGIIASKIQNSENGTFTFPSNVIIPGDVTIKGKLSVGENDDKKYTLSVDDDGKTTIKSNEITINGQTNLVNKTGNPLTTDGGTVLLNSSLGTTGSITIKKDLVVSGQVSGNLNIKGGIILSNGKTSSSISHGSDSNLKLVSHNNRVNVGNVYATGYVSADGNVSAGKLLCGTHKVKC